MTLAPARLFGVVIDRSSGSVRRIINPDFDVELDLHQVYEGERMLRLRKDACGISRKPDSMTLADVRRIELAFGGKHAVG